MLMNNLWLDLRIVDNVRLTTKLANQRNRVNLQSSGLKGTTIQIIVFMYCVPEHEPNY